MKKTDTTANTSSTPAKPATAKAAGKQTNNPLTGGTVKPRGNKAGTAGKPAKK